MPNYWTTGQLAAFAGLSIRTLRYYDQIGLFSPSLYTEAGHRRYTSEDMQQLLQILVLKKMHLPLEEIKKILHSNDQNLIATLDLQIDQIKSEIAVQQKLLYQLKQTRKEASKAAHISFQGLTSLFELIQRDHYSYFTTDQLQKVREHYLNTNVKERKHREKQFKDLLVALKDSQEKEVHPLHPSVQKLAKQWLELTEFFSDGNKEIIKNAEKFYTDHPQPALHYGIDGDLYQYIQEALNPLNNNDKRITSDNF